MTFDIIKAIILGVVEGLTEFVPVSSTGHLLLLEQFFGFGDEDFGKSFTVLIQFGAILALLSIYSVRLWQLFVGMFNDAQARRFVIGVLIAFLPAAVIGALAYKFIKEVLFNPWIVCVVADHRRPRFCFGSTGSISSRAITRRRRFTLPMYLVIGLAQCVSMIPGVSRSGRDHRVGDAARRRPARGGGILVLARHADHGRRVRLRSLQEPRADEPAATSALVAVGFIVSFISAWFVVKTFLGYVSRHGFTLFVWWRVAVGTAGLIALALGL